MRSPIVYTASSMHYKSTELPGGHRQHVAIARVELIIDVLHFQSELVL